MRSITPFAGARPTAEPPPPARLHDGTHPARVHALGARDPIHGAIVPAEVRPGDPVVARVQTTSAPGGALAQAAYRVRPQSSTSRRASSRPMP